jgi:hypothetical protein
MSEDPFQRDGSVDTPGLVGARWWQQQLGAAATGDQVSRRSAMSTVLIVGASLGALGLFLALVTGGNDDDAGPTPTPPSPAAKPALEVQKDYGWNFGARSEALVFDGASNVQFDAAEIPKLVEDLEPATAAYRPFWSPTLFQAPTAMPTATAEADQSEQFKPLKDVLSPIHTAAMDAEFARGRALARELSKLTDVAVIVDLAGPDAVSFAAGMAGLFDVVFAFENWPHPRGVVPAHRTLAAALYYQPLFKKTRTVANGKPPVILLDRDRLTSYVDETKQFDNRWVAKLPSAENLTKLGIKRVLYVTPNTTDVREMDDVNDDVVAWNASGIDVRMLGATAFTACKGKSVAVPTDDSMTEPYCYGGAPETDPQFLADYGWGNPSVKPSLTASSARDWRPKPRASTHSTGGGVVTAKPRPTNFGTVPVMLAFGTGTLLGWRHHRNGSWNRAPVPVKAGGGGGWGFG